MAPGLLLWGLLLALSSAPRASASLQYGSVIDAGSSGSRIFIFSWDARTFPSLPPPVTTPVEVVFDSQRVVEPGVDTPAGRQALPRLLELGRARLEALGLSSADIGAVPLYLKATAGMRMLTEEARAAAMAEVRTLLAQGPFLFRPQWARTISGEEEGVSGWITANYNAGLLPGQPGQQQQQQQQAPTLGALDLGGASAQITFAPPAGVDILSSSFDVRLTSAASISLYTHSFLYYGQNEAARRVNELVVLASGLGAGATIPHPCFLTGTPAAFLAFNSTTAGGLVTFEGASNWAACKAYVLPLMLRSAQCLTDPRPALAPWAGASLASRALQLQDFPPPPALPPINPSPALNGSTCSVGGQYQAPLVPPPAFAAVAQPVRFIAFSTYSNLYAALALARDAPLQQLRSVTAAYCALDFAGANASFPSARGRFLFNYCFLGVFAETLLREGFGLNDTASGIVTVAAPGSVSWALGAMLYESNGLPFSLAAAAAASQAATVTALAATLGVVLAAGAALGVLAWRRWPASANSAQYSSMTNPVHTAVGSKGGELSPAS
jgi:hypothetical protein